MLYAGSGGGEDSVASLRRLRVSRTRCQGCTHHVRTTQLSWRCKKAAAGNALWNLDRRSQARLLISESAPAQTRVARS